MASAGMAGFAQGLANSPLGNLPALYQAKQRMDMEKEHLAMRKQQYEDDRRRRQEREVRLLKADEIGEKEGLAAAVDYLYKTGFTEEAINLSNINQNRGLADYRDRALDEQKRASLVSEDYRDRALSETERANIAREGLSADTLDETTRSNRASEDYRDRALDEQKRASLVSEDYRDRTLSETERSNLAREGLGRDTLAETSRANRVGEQYRLGTLEETVRANQAREGLGRDTLAETSRSNLATEGYRDRTFDETVRSNIATEGYRDRTLDETIRSNIAAEDYRAGAFDETVRSNRATEGYRDRTLDETVRANQATEQYRTGTLDETIRANKEREYFDSRAATLADRMQDAREIEMFHKMDAQNEQNAQIRTEFEQGQTEKALQMTGAAYMNMGFTPADYSSEQYAAYVNNMFQGNSKMIQKSIGLSTNRIVVGADVITDENGRTYVAPKILNKTTRSVGPMTVKGTTGKTDKVYQVPAEQFDSIMRGYGSGPAAERDVTTFEQDGVTYKLDKKSGQSGAVGMTEGQANERRAANRIDKDADRIFGTKETIQFDILKDRNFATNIAHEISRMGVNDAGLVSKISVAMRNPEVAELRKKGGSESLNEAMRIIYELILPEADKSDPAVTIPVQKVDPRRNMPIRQGSSSPGLGSYSGRGPALRNNL